MAAWYDRNHSVLGRSGRFLLIALSLASCAPASPAGGAPSIEGFEDLRFGMSFNEAVGLAGPHLFSPYALKKCMIHRVIRGCHLNSIDNLTPYRTIEGVPYTLTLSFNRFDKLTDIDLQFKRSTIDGEGQRLSEAECLQVLERTVDWVAAKYGPLEEKPRSQEGPSGLRRTVAGKPYFYYPGQQSSEGFIAEAFRQMDKGRRVFVLSSYLTIGGHRDCSIGLSLSDVPAIERWSMDPEKRSEFDRITKGE